MNSHVPPPIVDREGYRFSTAQERTIAFEALLRAHGIDIAPGSRFESIALSVFEALYQRDATSADPSTDVREYLKHLIGFNELAGLVLSVADNHEFSRLVPHLRLLNRGMSIQNMPSPGVDQATNKVFELFAGIMALHCGANLALDDDKAQGQNPDVLITIDDRRWGIACKSLHGSNPEGFIGHLEKAIDQIERSPAETGVVLFSIKNLLNQSRYWSVTNPDAVERGEEAMLSAFRDPVRPFAMLVDDANEIGNRLRQYLPQGYLENAFAGKKCLPGFLVWAHVVTAVVFDDLPVPTSARVMAWQHVGDTPPRDMAVLQRLHDAAYAGDKVNAPAP